MLNKDLPSPELLRKLLRYEPKTGKLFWLTRTADLFNAGSRSAAGTCANWNAKYAGKEAFTSLNGNGYRQGFIFNKNFAAHRVAWALHYGVWPENEIDHINHDRADNRIQNLRDVSRRENSINSKPMANNTSGFNGVHFDNKSKSWVATIRIKGKTANLGSFTRKSDAIATRRAANKIYGFHKNHGLSI